MGILSAIFSGQQGFQKAAQSVAVRASRIADASANPNEEHLAEDLVGLETDKVAAKANLRSAQISDGLMNELIQSHLSNKK